MNVPVDTDATATPAELLARAADDYANGWGNTNARTEAEAEVSSNR